MVSENLCLLHHIFCFPLHNFIITNSSSGLVLLVSVKTVAFMSAVGGGIYWRAASIEEWRLILCSGLGIRDLQIDIYCKQLMCKSHMMPRFV